MPSRFIAFLLALVICGSGFTIQGPVDSIAMTTAEQVNAASSGEPETPPIGVSLSDLQLDELPAAGPAETLADLQILLMDCAETPDSGLLMVRVRPCAALTRLAPYLDAPQRPPCATSIVA